MNYLFKLKKNAAFLPVVVLCFCHIFIESTQGQTTEDFPLRESSTNGYLQLVPDLAASTLKDGRANIPFIVKNVSSKNMTIFGLNGRIAGLIGRSKTGKRTYLNFLIDPKSDLSFSGGPDTTVLKPGESKTYGCVYSMDELAFAAKLKGGVTGTIGATASSLENRVSYDSAPFQIPVRLYTPPWTDLGETKYLSLTPDLAHVGIGSGEQGIVIFPIKVTNTGRQPYVAATNSIDFYVARAGSGRAQPSAWETIGTSTPVLKPGESGTSTGRCYMMLRDLTAQGYKQGDKIVAAIGGRIPNTNQIFECYSEPFELPPLPKN